MKKFLIFALMLFALQASAQRNFPLNGPSSITSIHSGNEASEGDLYYDTTSTPNDLYIGLWDGTLYLMDQDSQSISLVGNILSITRGNSVDLSPFVNSDNQDLGSSASGTDRTITITGGNDTTIDIADNDNDSSNEIQDLTLSSNTLAISSDPNTDVDLTPYLDNTDEQDLGSSASGTDRTITITGGNDTTIDIADNDNDSSNEIQDLTLASNILAISSDPNTDVDLTPYLDNTDEQDLGSSASGTDRTITITGGNNTTIDIADNDNDSMNEIQSIDQFEILPETDLLSISLSSDGVAPLIVDLGDYYNTDEQTLTYTNSDPDDNVNTLQIENRAAFNIDDNHLGTNDQTLQADRTVTMSGRSLTFDGTQDVIIEADGDVGIGTSAPAARLDVDNGTVRFSDYGSGNVLDTLTGTHPHSEYHLGVLANGDLVEVNTVKSAKIFYPPSIVIDVSTTSSDFAVPGDGGDESKDLYLEYFTRFNSPLVGSPNGPAAIPTYSRDELYYYVTDLDPSVFVNAEVDDDGNFTYDIASVPTGNCTWINVVFVVK